MGILSSIGSAVSKATSAVSKAASSSKSGSSGSSGSSSKSIDDYKKDYAAAKAAGNADAMKAANDGANAVRAASGQAAQHASGDIASVRSNSNNGDWIGGSYDPNRSGGYAPNPSSNNDIINSAFSTYKSELERAEREKAAALQAAVDKYVAQANDQKGKVSEAGASANTAANAAYMQAANPYGANAEGLAARGLAFSGVAESSKISSGNAYQNALNQNKRQVNDQLSSIDAAIRDARLTGDIQKAEALASYYEKVANAGIQNAQSIIDNNKWQSQFDQQKNQNEFNNALAQKNFDFGKSTTEAQLTGQYNGKDTYQVQQDNRNVLIKNAETLAQYGDFSGYKALGLTDAQIANMKAAYQKQMAASLAKKTSGSTGGGGRVNAYKPRISYAQAKEAYENGDHRKPITDALSYYLQSDVVAPQNQNNQSNAAISNDKKLKLDNLYSQYGGGKGFSDSVNILRATGYITDDEYNAWANSMQ